MFKETFINSKLCVWHTIPLLRKSGSKCAVKLYKKPYFGAIYVVKYDSKWGLYYLLWGPPDVRKPWQACLVHVANHYLVFSVEHKFAAKYHWILLYLIPLGAKDVEPDHLDSNHQPKIKRLPSHEVLIQITHQFFQAHCQPGHILR